MSAVDAITPTTPATTTAEAGGASSVASPPPLSPSDITDAPIVASTNSTDATPLVKEVDGKQYVTCKFVFSYYEHIKYTAQFPLDTPLRSVIKKLHEDWPYGDEVTKVDETAIQLLFQGKRIVSNKNTQMLNVLLQELRGVQMALELNMSVVFHVVLGKPRDITAPDAAPDGLQHEMCSGCAIA